MDVFLQQLLNALSLGGTYALLALGLAVVFSIIGLINFAHGELMTIAGYVVAFSLAAALPLPLGIMLAVVVTTLSAMAMEHIAFRPARGASTATLLLTSFVVSTILRVLFQNFISARPIPVPLPSMLSGVFRIGPLHLGIIQSVSIVTTAVMLAGLVLFLNRTVAGRAMRAAAEDFAVVRLMGLRANSIVATAFAISGLLAGVAGILWVAQRGSVDPLMGFLPVLKAFIAAIIGGLGSLPGAVAGGFLLGFIEVTLQAWLPSALLPYRDAFAITLVIAVLLLRPQGLLARKTVIKL